MKLGGCCDYNSHNIHVTIRFNYSSLLCELSDRAINLIRVYYYFFNGQAFTMLTLQHYANELQQLQSKFENTNGIGIKV